MCGALSCARRWCLSSKEDTLLADYMRGILRRHGALPLPRVTALLSDEMLDIMSNITGGLRRYLQDRPSRYRVEVLSSGVTVVMLESELRRAGPCASTIAQVLANVAASPQQQMSLQQLFRALPALEQRRCGNEHVLESVLQQHPSFVAVQNGIVRAVPTSFALQRGLTSTPSSPLLTGVRAAMVQETLPEPPVSSNTVVEDAKMNKLLALLRSFVPCSYYVPLRYVTESSRGYMCFSVGMPVNDVLEELQRVSEMVLDCRVIGNGLDDVFLRMMDAERRPHVGDDSASATQYAVLSLGRPLIEAFRAYAARGPENKERLQSGIAMTELRDVLPLDLLERCLQLYKTTQKDAACIFIFDRLRHLFDVNMTAYMVRPWEALPACAQPSSLTWQTTPLPVVLRHCLAALTSKPLSPENLFAALPATSRKQLLCAYSSVTEFVAQHSLYLLLKDDLVWTPYLAAQMQGARVPGTARGGASGRHLSDSLKARMLMEVLPLGHPVDWHKFRLHPLTRDLPFSTRELRQDFFERHRDCFRLYEVLGVTALIVGRRDGTPPPSHLLQPPCTSLSDLVRQVALFSIGGAQEATILNNLSKEARMMVRRYGTLEHIVRQLPMWFDVRNERREQGSAIISYIAADPEHTSRKEQTPMTE